MNDKSGPVRLVGPEGWAALPVQPPAGAYRRWMRYPLVCLLGSLPMMFIIGLASPRSAGLRIVLVLIFAQCAGIFVLSVLAYRPYRRERQLGYTTWPSSAELRIGR